LGLTESGDIGEDPNGLPNNSMPIISQVAVGRGSIVNIFGDDYRKPMMGQELETISSVASMLGSRGH